MKNIKELRLQYNLSRKGLSELTNIPVRTIQSWELEEREAPEYIYQLIENTLKSNVIVTPQKTLLVPSSEVIDITNTKLNTILKKDYDTLSKEEIAMINQAYIIQMNNEHQKKDRGGIYGFTQRHLAYNSSKMEGNQLTEDDTATLFETDQLPQGEFRRKDVEEMTGHFIMFNYMLSHLDSPLSIDLIKAYHRELESGVFEFRANGYIPGEFKRRVNSVNNLTTSRPEDVLKDMTALLSQYKVYKKEYSSISSLGLFHSKYEHIHPFQDGNGRTGRMILFRECLLNNQLPFVIEDANKGVYRTSLNLAQTQDIHEPLIDFFKDCQQNFYKTLQEYMYDHSIELENDYEVR